MEILINFLSYLKNNYVLTGFNMIPLILIFLFLIRLNNKYLVFISWIYSALIPPIFIMVNSYFRFKENAYFIIFYVLINIIYICLQKKFLIRNYKFLIENTSSPSTTIIEVIDSDYGKNKSLEYVALFILPFITINPSVSILTIFFVLLLVVLIIIRFKIFYLNIPMLIFFKIQVVKTNRGLIKIVLTDRNFIFSLKQSYDIRNLNKSLGLSMYIERDS